MSSPDSTKKRRIAVSNGSGDDNGIVDDGITMSTILAKLNDMENRFISMQSELDKCNSSRESMQKEMDGMQSRLSHIDELEKKCDRLEKECTHLDIRCDSLQRSVEILSKESKWKYSAPPIPLSHWRGFPEDYVDSMQTLLSDINEYTRALRSGGGNSNGGGSRNAPRGDSNTPTTNGGGGGSRNAPRGDSSTTGGGGGSNTSATSGGGGSNTSATGGGGGSNTSATGGRGSDSRQLARNSSSTTDNEDGDKVLLLELSSERKEEMNQLAKRQGLRIVEHQKEKHQVDVKKHRESNEYKEQVNDIKQLDSRIGRLKESKALLDDDMVTAVSGIDKQIKEEQQNKDKIVESWIFEDGCLKAKHTQLLRALLIRTKLGGHVAETPQGNAVMPIPQEVTDAWNEYIEQEHVAKIDG